VSQQFDRLMAFSPSLSLSGGMRAVSPAPVQVQVHYSALHVEETALPQGMRPTSLLQAGTGADIVGDLLRPRSDEVVRTVRGSLELITAVAQAVPTNAADERVVDALVARSTAGAKRRPLKRQ
jgi:hypothetical protein